MRRAAAVALIALTLAALAVLQARREREPGPSALQAPAAELARGAEPEVMTPDPRIDRTGWPVIVAFGDSLTAGLGVDPNENYPSQLQAQLDARGYRYRVVSAGVSGELTAGGLGRVEQVLEHRPQIVILELGANDGLQARPVAEVRENLAAIIARLQEAGVIVLLAGMRAPPNFGPEYEAAFAQIYPDLAAEFGVPLIPFFLEGVAGSPYLNQRDGIHPTAEGYAVVVRTVLSALEPLLQPP
ncbi:MAG: arylesterase [Bacillota bacterium]|nr:MAG: arylesterase [Bacillota bacterium]